MGGDGRWRGRYDGDGGDGDGDRGGGEEVVVEDSAFDRFVVFFVGVGL